jgi:FixJ family two-component response regulator
VSLPEPSALRTVEKPGPESKAIVFVVDDVSLREASESFVRSAGFEVETFASAQGFFRS